MALAGAIALAACNKEEIPAPAPGDNSSSQVKYDLEDKLIPTVYYTTGSSVEEFRETMQLRSAVTAGSAEEADMIVVESSELENNRELLSKAWEDGKMIVELLPNNKTHYDFWKSIGAPVYLLPEEESNDLLFLAMHEYECYQLQNPFLLMDFNPNTNVEPDENASETTDQDELKEGNYDAIVVEIEKTAEYLNTKFASFVDWANENMPSVGPLTKAGSSSFDGDLSKRIADSKFSQHITKTLTVGADDYQICKVIASVPDKVSRHSTIDLNITITPLYAYQDCNPASVAGDYYFITMYVLSHNEPLYGLYKVWHGAVRTWAHVFYSDKIEFQALLQKTSGLYPDMTGRVSFFETPKPTSTQSSTSYTVGFTGSLNVNGQGGYTNGNLSASLTVGGSFSWSNSHSRTVADQSIEMSTTSDLASVKYDFITNNVQWEDETKDAIPAIARTDQKCEASWCWRVAETKDDDASESFVFRLLLFPYYGCQWRHATWGAEGARKSECLLAPKFRNMYFPINVPNRQRNGVIEFKNTANLYVADYKIIDTNDKVIVSTGSAYEKNAVIRYQVPVGKYRVIYNIVNGDTGKVTGTFGFSGVEVATARTSELYHANAQRII